MLSKALLRFAFAAALGLLISLPALAESHVRIVRLSYIEGGVTIDRNTGQFEKAIVNLPITEGAKLRTGEDGRAEVEFEDGSTLRLASNTTVQFPTLTLRDSGGKNSVVDIQNGTAYVDFAAAKHDELTLLFGKSRTTLTQSAHLRVDANDSRTALAVFKGDVHVESPSGTAQVKKNQTVAFDGENAQAVIAKNIEPEPLDSWDKKQSQYHQVYASNSYRDYSPYAYGTSDLGYYGSFFSAPGYGMLWQPYFIGAGWDPFMDGAWAFSPGFGYGWVSAYPWGWVPYHYGTWVFLPGYGWAWQPGGAWMPYYSQPLLLNAPSGFRRPQPPAATPVKGTTILAVNRGAAPTIANQPGSKIMIRSNSAGLGVPRGLSNIAKVSQQAQTKGMVAERIPSRISAPPRSMMQPGMTPGMAGGMRSPRGEGSRPAAPRMSSPPPSPPSAPRMSMPAPPASSPRR